jgi:hypothetical protein
MMVPRFLAGERGRVCCHQLTVGGHESVAEVCVGNWDISFNVKFEMLLEPKRGYFKKEFWREV